MPKLTRDRAGAAGYCSGSGAPPAADSSTPAPAWRGVSTAADAIVVEW